MAPPASSARVVDLLAAAARSESREATDRLTALLYEELRRLARQRMRRENAGHTLQTTALVHEAYVRLVQSEVSFKDRVHFLALASRVMRQILVDHARHRTRAKRGDGAPHLSLTLADGPAADARLALDDPNGLLVLHDTIDALAVHDPRKARLLELQVFGGLSYAELAEATGISEATVHRELRMGRAWLRRALEIP